MPKASNMRGWNHRRHLGRFKPLPNPKPSNHKPLNLNPKPESKESKTWILNKILSLIIRAGIIIVTLIMISLTTVITGKK